ncbi:MAG: type II secretion system protein N [Pseudomonadota bacterium]
MNRSSRGLLIAGLVTFILGVIALFPARAAVNWFVPDGVQVSGIRGTVWSGGASAVSAPGVYLSRLEWRLSALSLLIFRPSVTFTAVPGSGFVEGVATVRGSTIELEDLNASLPLSMIAASVRTPGLNGNASAQFEQLTVTDGLPVSARGTVRVANLQLPLVYPGSLGGYALDFVDADAGIVASIEDVDGIVDVAGSLNLQPDRSYQLLAQVAVLPTTPTELAERMRFMPRGNAEGQYEIRLEGSL